MMQNIEKHLGNFDSFFKNRLMLFAHTIQLNSFRLPNTEVIIDQFDCYIKQIVKQHVCFLKRTTILITITIIIFLFVAQGTLFISPNYVCFRAKVFGKVTKIVLPV
jgi:hypothetical protein